MDDISAVRLEVGDNDPALPLLSDAEVQYYLDSSSGNVRLAAISAAKAILMKLSQRGNYSVDIFSEKNSDAAKNYIAALKLWLRDPTLSPVVQDLTPYAGGINRDEFIANRDNPDSMQMKLPKFGRIDL